MGSALRCILALWCGWGLVWLIAALSAAPTASRQGVTATLTDRLLIGGGAVLMVLHGPPGSPFHDLLRPDSWLAWSGAVLVAAGAAVALWARLRLGRYWSGVAALKESHALVRVGPYARVRHPIYLGMLLALAGTGLAVGTPAALVGLGAAAAGLTMRIRREEALLLGHFGDAYRAYRAEVPALLPRLGRPAAGGR